MALESSTTMTMIPNHKAAAASAPTGSDVHFKDAVKLLRAKFEDGCREGSSWAGSI